MERPSWAPPGIDLDQPSIARVYDYYLGGFHNFSADRAVVEHTLRVMPQAPMIAQSNRGFLARAVRFCVDAGITQFLDIGSGIPTVGNVHEVAQRAEPRARVVYVDIDPVAVAHSREILAGNEQATVIQADLRQPEHILSDPAVRGMLDLDRPVALLMIAVLHFIPDTDDPAGVIERFHQALAPGSHLALSGTSADDLADDQVTDLVKIYQKSVAPLIFRTREEITKLFGGFDLVEPGVVAMGHWRSDPADQPTASYGFAGVGRKP